MKRLLLILLPITVNAQKSSLFKHTQDRFTGERIVQLIKPVTARDNSIGIDFVRTSKNLGSLYIATPSSVLGCTIDHHIVRFLFKDGSSASAYNSSKDCKGTAIIFFYGGPIMNAALAHKLQDQNIAAIRIESDGTDLEFDISDIASKKIKSAALEFFGDTNTSSTGPVDSTAETPKRAVVPGRAKL